ncbi:Type IV fimbrial biogenesis protein PilY1 [Chondromyces apiculatus DSM 436]|uniref:Type IV fimbrial biogenesis protein PilY1 n=2 Tax=Chondromyces apiculatus TaxID=51 RepID=A0A017TAR1_9BACT|nr:Type IV fimbrial biogenesis protein PilY1 [Chondromyces apiculatus DSM 436]
MGGAHGEGVISRFTAPAAGACRLLEGSAEVPFMRGIPEVLPFVGGMGALVFHAAAVQAQIDVEPPAPNVLLLLDTSGSMERTVAGGLPVCAPLGVPPPEGERSRFTNVVEALTGPVAGFSCLAQRRTEAPFVAEYRVGGVDPYDRGYYLPFHRILSHGCAKGPGATGIVEHAYTSPSTPCATPFAALGSGFLDTAQDHVRFALMTFDTLPHAGTGWAGAPHAGSGVEGMWSYFPGFQGSGQATQGSLPGCAPRDFEVGAKNPAAPPWEGPLVPFPASDAEVAVLRAQSAKVQEMLLAVRPYGATPVAAMLADARDYLLHDDTTWEGAPLGPRSDPCVQNGSRAMYMVLISDGEPNLDLRPECAATAGAGPEGNGCPHEAPHVIAASLRAAGIKTFAVGYSLSAQAGMACEDIDAGSFGPGGVCAAPSGPVAACCALARIGLAGGTGGGKFPDSGAELSAALGEILAEIAQPTSRTLPVLSWAPATGGGAAATTFQIASSLNPGPEARWTGNLERKRHVCEVQNGTLAAVPQPVEAEAGDDFGANLAAAGPAGRRLFTVLGASAPVASDRSVRPHLAVDDGLGLVGGAMTGGGPAASADFVAAVAAAPRALGLDPGGPLPSACATVGGDTAGSCAERVLRWEIGEGVPGMDAAATREGRALGAIYHATPAVVGAPRELVLDEAYARFAAAHATRATVLYAATTDGQLHAFQVAPGDAADPLQVEARENNELWSFFPPHVLPRLPAAHGVQVDLLDGTPTVKDIVFTRSRAQALAAASDAGAAYRTVLVAGGGAAGGFYYALDVTEPKAPVFLWQLSTDAGGRPLFGETAPQPAVALLEIEEAGEVREVGVAILAGGAAPVGDGACARQAPAGSLVAASSPYQPRAAGRCWGGAGSGEPVGASRSLTVVRLDTGAVVRSFRGEVAEAPPGLAARVTVAPFDAPLTGAPVAYPGQPGQVADRIYVGDADGALWRVDVSRPDPETWSAALAWDAYSLPGDGPLGGQPIDTTPVISVDGVGDPVILLSTGDQQAFTASDAVETRLWSLSEASLGGQVSLRGLWHWQFVAGKRVTGPLSLFDGAVYFATFAPGAGGAAQCTGGAGAIWALDYLTGAARLPSSADPGLLVAYEEQPPNTVVFGVAVAQTPTCYETLSVGGGYFGPATVFSSMTTPAYALVYHTGAAGPEDAEGARTRSSSRALPPPAVGASLRAWASVVE